MFARLENTLMSFSTSISPYLYLFSKDDNLGILSGFNPLKISVTYIFATRRGVPLKLSSVKSNPKISSISFILGFNFASFFPFHPVLLWIVDHSRDGYQGVVLIFPGKKPKLVFWIPLGF